MKQLIHLFLLLNIYGPVSAQSFAIINDTDDFVIVRENPNVKSKVRGKLHINEIFSYDASSKAEWVEIYREDSRNTGLEGYIQKSELLPLSLFKSTTSHSITNNSVTVMSGSMTLKLTSKPFNAKNHKLKFENPYPQCKNCILILSKIDNRFLWGTDGGAPKKAVKSLNMTFKGLLVSIPTSAFSDLYEPVLNSIQVFQNKKTIYIQMDNGDGAGGYTVIWVIKNGHYIKRYLDDSHA
ncbi:SH3 domain-containing protein [Mucilaginibacter aquatilis]|uniref:SH3b domain-containing protein n=1 Tax=Mucilaginibacter aquatilis TaxID=1517760 RepID=A0A6I4IP82_9SPHI|nr:SH3 domain-containing protein [Mucilaginibacter aquatilis]MVN89513.1 hypothetical protein [Mucilaginibacter aquatilis]